MFVNPGVTLTVVDSAVSGNVGCNSISCSSGSGGGIYNWGTTSVTNSTVSGNSGCTPSSCFGYGGGMYNRGTMSVTGSTVSGNYGCTGSTCSGTAGGVYSYSGAVTLTNSTLAGNIANIGCSSSTCTGFGGGIDFNTGTAALTNATVSGNSGCSQSGCTGDGGGIYSSVTTTVTNTILAGNTAPTSGNDCYGTLADGSAGGDNLIGDGTWVDSFTETRSCGPTNGTNGDQGGSTGNLVDPKLGTLQDNGGPTATMALLPGSPAIHAGDFATCTGQVVGDVDQRGEPRPASGSSTSCDIGAYDTQGSPVVYVSPAGSDTNTCAAASAPCQHIRVGLATVAAGGIVHIAGGTFCEQMTVDRSMTLLGNAGSGAPTIIDGGAATINNPCRGEISGHSVVTVGDANSTGMRVTLQDLTIQDGDATNSGYSGGVVVYPGAALTVADSAVRENFGGNEGSGDGGGIYSEGTALTLINSTVSGNVADGYGGGIYNDSGTMTVTNSTVSGNVGCSATDCSGETGYGGGIYSEGTALTLINSTVSGNTVCAISACSSSGDSGGGIESASATTTLINSTVSGNVACTGFCSSSAGGGIEGAATLMNSIVAGNAGAPSSPDCSGSLSDGSLNGTNVGNNIIGDNTGCSGLTDGTNGDQVGTGSGPIDPKLGPLQNNGGPTMTMAVQVGSPAWNHGNVSVCNAASVNGLDQRGLRRESDRCDVGAYDHFPVAIAAGWNLLDRPVTNAQLATASGLVIELDGATELGAGAIRAVATYASGRFALYVPGYSTDLTLPSSQGMFVLSSRSGFWAPPGTAVSPSPQVTIVPGWNLVAMPATAGHTADVIAGQIGTGIVQEIAALGPSGYQVYTPGSSSPFAISPEQGFWVLASSNTTWMPT